MHSLRASVLLAIEAVAATTAGKEIAEHYPVANRQRLIVRVDRQALAKRGDSAGPFMPLVDRNCPSSLGGI
jgi:hypothetical protein